jgi:hypothetical protein
VVSISEEKLPRKKKKKEKLSDKSKNSNQNQHVVKEDQAEKESSYEIHIKYDKKLR